LYFISIRYNNDEESNEEEEDDEEEEEEEEEEEAQKEIYSVSSTSEPDEEVSTDEDGYASEVRDVQVKIEVGDQQTEDKDDGSFMEEDEVVNRMKMMNLLEMTPMMFVTSLDLRLIPPKILTMK